MRKRVAWECDEISNRSSQLNEQEAGIERWISEKLRYQPF